MTRTDLDLHADSAVVGKNDLILETHETSVKVNGFTPSFGTKTVPVVNAAVAYDDVMNSRVVILLIYNALYISEISQNLIPPFAMRLSQLDVNKMPKFMADRPTIKHYSVYCKKNEFRIPLSLHGIISYMPTRFPSNDEYQSVQTRIELTPPSLSWNPHSNIYANQEDNMMDYKGDIVVPTRHTLSTVTTEETLACYGIISVRMSMSPAFTPWKMADSMNHIFGFGV